MTVILLGELYRLKIGCGERSAPAFPLYVDHSLSLCFAIQRLVGCEYEISAGPAAGFHLSFPCTLNVTAIATMHVVLHLQASSGRRVNGSPLAFSLRKRCEASTPNIGL